MWDSFEKIKGRWKISEILFLTPTNTGVPSRKIFLYRISISSHKDYVSLVKRKKSRNLSMVTHTCNASTWVAEAGWSSAGGHSLRLIVRSCPGGGVGGMRTHREHIWPFRDSETTSLGRSQPNIKPSPRPCSIHSKDNRKTSKPWIWKVQVT